jgi:hypothetical protein
MDTAHDSKKSVLASALTCGKDGSAFLDFGGSARYHYSRFLEINIPGFGGSPFMLNFQRTI